MITNLHMPTTDKKIKISKRELGLMLDNLRKEVENEIYKEDINK